jgi:monoamine oxidase
VSGPGRRLTRAALLRRGGVAAVALGSVPALRAVAGRGHSRPRVVVVGAGLAGLRCAHVLWRRHGIPVAVHEWDSRAGGRCETLRGFFHGGQTVDQHGEFISSEHTAMRALARHFDLRLQDVNRVPPGTDDTYWFGGSRYTRAQLDADWRAFGRRLFRDAVARAPWPTRHGRHVSQAAREWDHQSVPEWIERHVPGGLRQPFGKLLIQDVIDEYGGDPADQSALNLVYLLGYDDSTESGYQPHGGPALSGTDERFHIIGGNDQVVSGMLDELPSGTVTLDSRLVALRRRPSGGWVCSFESGASTRDVSTDHVVLALPFATLRHVDLDRAGLPALKLRAIRTLGMGTNSKVQLQFARPVWVGEGFDGTFYTDTGGQSGWQAPSDPPGAPGVMVDFLGAQEGRGLGARYGLTADEGPAPAALVADTLRRLEPVYPGIGRAWNGLAYVNWSPGDEHIGGSYSYYRVGQYTGISGVEPGRVGSLHFAGEHTSLEFQGYMEGAVRSGERVAGEIAGRVA